MITGGGVAGSSAPAVAFGTAAARPAAAAANANTGYYATDTGEVTFSNGASWSSIAKTSNAAGLTAVGFQPDQTGTVGSFTAQGGEPYVRGTGTGTARWFDDLDVNNPGRGVRVAEGANAKQGTATLVAGSVVVANTSVTANSRIFLTSQADGGAPGFLRVSARVAGTSFTVTSSSGTDTSTFAYEMFEPG